MLFKFKEPRDSILSPEALETIPRQRSGGFNLDWIIRATTEIHKIKSTRLGHDRLVLKTYKDCTKV